LRGGTKEGTVLNSVPSHFNCPIARNKTAWNRQSIYSLHQWDGLDRPSTVPGVEGASV
jgi:hypothetical protein